MWFKYNNDTSPVTTTCFNFLGWFVKVIKIKYVNGAI